MSDPGTATSYPVEREADVVLRDGSTVRVRPVRGEDQPAIRAFLHGVSRESIGFRFFGFPDLEWATASRCLGVLAYGIAEGIDDLVTAATHGGSAASASAGDTHVTHH